MKTYHIPVLNSEYEVTVIIGTKEECWKEGARLAKKSDVPEHEWWFRDIFKGRGHTFNFPDLQPIVMVNGDLPVHSALATLAHEACHAADFISNYVCMDDKSGEFRAHTVGAIMRHVGKDVLKRYGKMAKK